MVAGKAGLKKVNGYAWGQGVARGIARITATDCVPGWRDRVLMFEPYVADAVPP